MADTSMQWVDVGGVATEILDGTDVYVLPGLAGRMSPSMSFILQRVPLQPGQRFRDVRHGVAEVKVPVELYGATDTALRSSVRTWVHRLDPFRGDGKLRITAPAGDQRELICRCAEGLDQAVEDEGDVGHRLRAILRFVTEQPYWQDASDTVQTWTLLSSLATFFPLFPLRLSGSEVFADATVTNDGDVEAWPVWTIAGPGSSPILRNLTTGDLLSLPVTLLAGESVTIDTRPGAKTVTKQNGTSLFGSLTATSSLWPLAQGSNSVRIEMSGATSVSSVALNWRRRWLSA
jgi:Phage tail protein